METLSEQIVAEAFALSKARGAELLARLGSFGVWQGDLAAMRGDDPREPIPDEEDASTRPMRDFVDTLVLAEAIERLQPVCRAALSAVYAERKDTASLAADLDTDAVHAQRIVTNCEQRLLEIYETLLKDSAGNGATVPQWVTEREHAAAGNGRRG